MADPLDALPRTITCVDCGGTCHLLSVSEAGEPGVNVDTVADDVIVAAYRCEDCHDRWDLEFRRDELDPA